MKWLPLTTALLLVWGCERAERASVEAPEEKERGSGLTITHRGQRMSMAQFEEVVDEQRAAFRTALREHALRDKEEFMAALEMTDFNWISRAFIAEKSQGGEVTVLRSLYGTAPSYPEDSFASWASPGKYLVARINRRDKFERHSVLQYPVSFPLSEDHTHFYWTDPDSHMSIEDLIAQLEGTTDSEQDVGLDAE